MLLELQVVNVAIIERQTIRFDRGLNVISGETGAGKSIILEALRLILGGRGSTEMIRSGCESLEVTALFDLTSVPKEVLESLPDIITDGSDLSAVEAAKELVLTRELHRSGRNKIYINGRSGTVTLLSQISERLINICGQNQSLQLFDRAFHLNLIDDYGNHDALLGEYRQNFKRWFEVKNKISEHEKGARDLVMRQQGLEAIVSELSPLNLRVGYKEEIEQEVKRLAFGEQLINGSAHLVQLFEGEEGVSSILHEIGSALQSLAKIDQSLVPLKELFDAGKANLEELERELNSYAGSLTLDEEKLRTFQDKLSDIVRLERKYRTDEAGLIKILTEASVELEALTTQDDIDELRAEEAKYRSSVDEVGARLRTARQKTGQKLIKEVERELAEVNMKDARLKVAVEPTEPTSTGVERVELLISTNRGEDFKEIRQVASGGELSRIMLILKKVLKDRSGINVLVFDEVDAGISGGVARAVGEKLKVLAKKSQVICITHLAQVASLADRHLLVEKSTGSRTKTVVHELDHVARVEEIARMLAGYKVTAASRASAKELLSSKFPEG